jgi:hypothetical protein
MPLKSTILALNPTSYWPLDDVPGSAACLDAMGLTNASLPASGVTLAAVPFGASSAPLFDGAIGSRLTIASTPQYSQPFANALTVAVWICPLALDNANTAGSADQYVHFLEKAVTPALDTEWAMRLYNQDNPSRHSRLSFYLFNLGATAANPTNKGAGSYMEFGVSQNDATPVMSGSWLFLVGEAEPWISSDDQTTGCILWKQDVQAKRIPQDKYEDPEFQVQPQAGPGPLSVGGTAETGFNGAIAHLAIWNRLLAQDEIDSIWTQGSADLQAAPT